MLNGVHPEPVTTVDKWGSALGFLDKIPEEMRLGIVKTFYTALGNDTAVVGLWRLLSNVELDNALGFAYSHDRIILIRPLRSSGLGIRGHHRP